REGIVLMSASGPVPTLAEAIAGEPISGSWWGHPKGKLIFRVASAVEDSPDVLSCRLVGGRVTLVHRRLWPALVRLAAQLEPSSLDVVVSEHTASGAHRKKITPFPEWVGAGVAAAAAALSEEDARSQLGPWLATGALALRSG